MSDLQWARGKIGWSVQSPDKASLSYVLICLLSVEAAVRVIGVEACGILPSRSKHSADHHLATQEEERGTEAWS